MKSHLMWSLLFIAACSNETPAVPQKEAAASESDIHVTAFSEQAVKNAGIETSTAAAGVVHETVLVYGAIQPMPEKVREVVARYPGVIRSVTHTVGDAVRAGEVLATVESNDSLQTYNVIAPIAGVITQRRANTGATANEQSLFSIADYSQVYADFNVFPRDRSRLKVGQVAQVSDAEGLQRITGRI
ncbi:MAG TPA: efflux RND transporter periplasmic adaptor subunit, partial [Steroidobacteraceae bacterium]|nr:efflux RND transporter periplasmic adaptor subunit [Steroidobacteraceae bacterium]